MNAQTPLVMLPRLFSEPEAAAYLGVSRSFLRTLPIPRRMLNARRLYDRMDLDAYASELPYEGDAEEAKKCDAIFGVSA